MEQSDVPEVGAEALVEACPHAHATCPFCAAGLNEPDFDLTAEGNGRVAGGPWVQRAEARAKKAEAAIERVRALHPRIDEPTHGCCARPKLCSGHPPECGGREHNLSRPRWPCPTLAALDGPGNPEAANPTTEGEPA